MSTFIWGKIKLDKKIMMNDYQRKSILVFFSEKKNDLFQSDLEDNEMYFNIACGYNQIVNPLSYKMDYLNCDDSYFSINSLEFEDDLEPYFKNLFLRILDLHDVIKEMFDNENVEQITYFHTETGNENSIDDYELVNWKLEEFADRFYAEIKNNKGFTPTIKVVFNKNL